MSIYCNACGTELRSDARFCTQCGRATPVAAASHQYRPLERPRLQRKLAGVCAGLANHMGADPTLVRILWVVISIVTGFFPGFLAYIVAWIVIPEEPMPMAAPAWTTPPPPAT